EVDLSNIKESGTIDVDLALPDGISAPDDDPVEVDVQLSQKKTVKHVPIDIKNVEENQDVSFVNADEPEMEVDITGKEEEIRDIKADDIDLSVDVDGMNEGEHEVAVKADGPDGGKVSGEFDKVMIDIS